MSADILPMPAPKIRDGIAAHLQNPRVRRMFAETLVRQDVEHGTVDDDLRSAALACLAGHLTEPQRHHWYRELCTWWEQRKFARDTGAPRHDVVGVDLDARVDEALRELGVA